MAYGVGNVIYSAGISNPTPGNEWNEFVDLLNRVWSDPPGYTPRDFGYGQPQFNTRVNGQLIQAGPDVAVAGVPGTSLPTWATGSVAGPPVINGPEWRAMVDSMNKAGLHQTGVVPITTAQFAASGSLPLFAGAAPGVIAWGSNFAATLTQISTVQRLNAATQGVVSVQPAVPPVSGTTFDSLLQFEFVVTFTNGGGLGASRCAEYFFNAGGQLRLDMVHPGGTILDTLVQDMIAQTGSIYISSTDGIITPTVNIVGTSYTGLQATNATPTPARTTYVTNAGYYGTTGAYSTVYQQGSTVGTPYDAGSYFRVDTRTAGNTLDIRVSIFVNAAGNPGGDFASPGTTGTVTVIYPSTAQLVDTWGPVTVTAVFTPACPSPFVQTPLPANTFSTGTPVPGGTTITIVNCTSATINSGLPTGVTATGAPSGANYVFTLAGTPTVGGQAWAIDISASNAAGGCSAVGPIGGLSGGAGTVAAVGCAVPTISISPATGTQGVAGTWTITAAPAGAGLAINNISNYPAWVNAASITGLGTGTVTFSGTPTGLTTPTFTVDANVTNACAITNPGLFPGFTPTTATVTSSAVTIACAAPSVQTTVTPTVLTIGSGGTAGIVLLNAPTSATITNLPAGLTQSYNNATGLLTITEVGTGSAGVTALLIDATNSCGATSTTVTGLAGGNLTLAAGLVCPLPSVGTLTVLTGTAGTAYTATITVTNCTSATLTPSTPLAALNLTASGAQSGLNYVFTITSASLVAGAVTFSVDNATNACGGGATTSGPIANTSAGTLTVGAAGACLTPTATIAPTTATVGVAGTWTVTVSNATVVNSVPSLPAWATATIISATTVNITGTPDASATSFTVGLNADNVCGGGLTPVNGATPTTNSVTVNCATPAVTATVNPTSLTIGVAGTATITLSNATSATITNLPAGLTQSFSAGVITITAAAAWAGTAGTTALLVDATNACGATSASATGLGGGSLTLNSAGACPAPTAGTITPTSVTVGQTYNGTFTINGATAVTAASSTAPTLTVTPGNPVTLGGSTATAAWGPTFTVTATADNVCGGGSTAVTGQNVTSAQVTVNCITPTIGPWTSTAAPPGPTVPFSGECCDLAGAAPTGNPINFQPYTPGAAPPGLPAVPSCALSFTVIACNDPNAAFLAYAATGFPDVVSCQPTTSPASGPFRAGWLYVDATKSNVVCPTTGQNSIGTCPTQDCN